MINNFGCAHLFVGPAVGLEAGCIVKTLKEKSWTKNSLKKITPDNTIAGRLNNFCEYVRFNKSGSLLGSLIQSTIVETLPLICAIFEEAGKQIVVDHSLQKSLSQATGSIIKIIEWTLVKTGPLHFLALIIVDIIKLISVKSARKANLSPYHKDDPSGHAISVCWNLMTRYHTLKLIQAAGLRSYTYIAYTAFMSIAEGVWLYKTTVDYHSARDMIKGSVFGAISVIVSCNFVSLTQLAFSKLRLAIASPRSIKGVV
jgi:hypothetical protein